MTSYYSPVPYAKKIFRALLVAERGVVCGQSLSHREHY